MFSPHRNAVSSFVLLFVVVITCSVAYAAEQPELDNALPAGFDDGGYFFSRTVDLPYDEAVAKVREELKKEGFGVITEIDVKATMKKKLDVDFPPYIILGACNPPIAHEALTTEDWIGTLMPCNVVVRVDEAGNVQVGAMNPALMASATGKAELNSLGERLRQKMVNVLEAL